MAAFRLVTLEIGLRPARLALLAVLAAAVPACQKKLASVAETPPPLQPPSVPAAAALRPAYDLNGRPVTAGTGFVVRDSAGKLFFLTAAHVMETSEWRRVNSVSLATVAGEPVGNLQPGGLKHIGAPFDRAGAQADLVIWEATLDKVTVLPLATEDLKRNEWVWVIGLEMSRRGSGRLFRCKVTGTQSGGIILEQQERFELRGFSGAPVVNEKGQVVGAVLGGSEPKVLCSKVTSIRERMSQQGIQLP
jgi:Trypsin-like peptidase domain